MNNHPSSPGIKVLTADDHPLLREGITSVLEDEGDIRVVAQADDGMEAVRLFRTHRPDVTLMDAKMPRMDGIEALARIRSEFPNARILVLTTYSGDALALRAIKAGAAGYMLKSSVRTELAGAVRAVHAGRRWIPADVATGLAAHVAEEMLSGREVEVLVLVACGNGNKAVANNLGVTEETIKAHVSNILAKLGAKDRAHAVAIALQRGIIPFDSP